MRNIYLSKNKKTGEPMRGIYIMIMENKTKYIFEDDTLKQRGLIKNAYAKILTKKGGVVIPNETLEKYREIYNNPKTKLAAAIRDFYKENLQGKTVDVEITDGVIVVVFGTDGRDKSILGHRMSPERAATFEFLDTLIENGEYAYSQTNQKNNESYAKQVPHFHYFVNNANVDGVDIPIKIQIREMIFTSGTEYRYYTHDFIKNRGNASSGLADDIGSGDTRNVSPKNTTI